MEAVWLRTSCTASEPTMKAPRKPAARVMELRPEADEMLLVTAETLETELQYGKNWCERLLNELKCVVELTVSEGFKGCMGCCWSASAVTHPWDIPSNIPRERAKRTDQDLYRSKHLCFRGLPLSSLTPTKALVDVQPLRFRQPLFCL
jgi:hypothetical protein